MGFSQTRDCCFGVLCVCLNCSVSIMCHMGDSPSWGLVKGGSSQAPGLIVLCQTAWIEWLILGCIAAPLQGRLLNPLSVTRPQVVAAPYAHPEQHHLCVIRHRFSPPISIYRSPASLKGGHGEWYSVFCSHY